MKKLLIGCLSLFLSMTLFAQNNNPVSIYEGLLIESVDFKFTNQPADTALLEAYMQVIESEFFVVPQTQFNSFQASYYISKLKLLPFIDHVTLGVDLNTQNNLQLTVNIRFITPSEKKVDQANIVKDMRMFPVLYNSERSYLTMKAAASEMIYSNDNAWFAQPKAMTTGNPLAENPVGKGYTGWLEGFASLGVYGIVKVIPKINLHLYGGVNYLASFSAGNELFTDKARIYGAIEEAFVGFVGGGVDRYSRSYQYNLSYGRKQFTLGDGWLIINTSMNGYDRASLQLNPRWAAKSSFQAGFTWNWVTFQAFSLKPNELDILNSHTTINGANLEFRNKKNGLLAFSFLQVPHSQFSYYMPDGTVYKRAGLQVYNLRVFKSTGSSGGLFFKTEGGYQRNPHFDMAAWAYYGELGWNFAKTKGSPALSYRYASFGGDNPNSKSYNRWDALYTGGTGEQWVQGSNMYKIVQNSNEISHRIQAIYSPLSKVQLVGQFWIFYADQKNNLGGNPALSTLESKFYGSEYNLTLKYFHSRNWYFHLNTAYTMPGDAIKDLVQDTRNWFCLSAFARYSF